MRGKRSCWHAGIPLQRFRFTITSSAADARARHSNPFVPPAVDIPSCSRCLLTLWSLLSRLKEAIGRGCHRRGVSALNVVITCGGWLNLPHPE